MANAYTLAIGVRASSDKLKDDLARAANVVNTTLNRFGSAGSFLNKLKSPIGDVNAALGMQRSAGERLEMAFQKLNGTLGQFGLSLGRVAAIVGGTAVAAFTALAFAVKRSVQDFRDLLGVATALGVSLNTIAKLAFAAEVTGVKFEQLRVAMIKSTKIMAEVVATGQDTTGIFKRLHMSASAFLKLNAEDRFLALADAISKIPREADRIRMAMQLFEEGGPQMLPLFQAGSEGLKRMEQEAAQLHLTFGMALKDVTTMDTFLTFISSRLNGIGKNDAIQNMANLSASFARVGGALVGMGRQLTAALAPFLSDLLNILAPVLVTVGALLTDIVRLFAHLGRSVLLPIVDILGRLIVAIGQIARVAVIGIMAVIEPVLDLIDFILSLPRWLLEKAGVIKPNQPLLQPSDAVRDEASVFGSGSGLARDNFPGALLRNTIEAASKALQLEFGAKKDIPAQQLQEAVKTNQLLARMQKDSITFAPATL